MSKIRAKDTKPELFVRSKLHKLGYRFRVNSKLAEGHPDLYFTKKRIAVFVHGCYWHRHDNCKFAYTPKSNSDFWLKKFVSNVERDRAVMSILENEHIRVMIVWECTVKRMMVNNVVCQENMEKMETFINNEDLPYIEL